MVKTGNRERSSPGSDSDRNGYRMGRQNEYQRRNLENVCSFLMED